MSGTPRNAAASVSLLYFKLKQNTEAISELASKGIISGLEDLFDLTDVDLKTFVESYKLPEDIYIEFQKISKLSSIQSITSGYQLFTKWKELVYDLFFFFEYMYEEGNGARGSSWDTFCHRYNYRIPEEDRNDPESLILCDTKKLPRMEILRSLAFSVDMLSLSLTSSQAVYRDVNIIQRNMQLQHSLSSPAVMERIEFGPKSSILSAIMDFKKKPELIYTSLKNGELVVRFFGMRDEDKIFTSHNILMKKLKSNFSKKISSKDKDTKFRVHFGFLRIYKSIDQECVNKSGFHLAEYIVNRFTNLSQEFPETNARERRLVITGHSMGAALACFAAYQIISQFPNLRHNVYAIIFGSPFFANSKFSKWIEEHMIDRIIRFEIEGDVVCKYPPLMKGIYSAGPKIVLSPEALIMATNEEIGDKHFTYWNIIRFESLRPQTQIAQEQLSRKEFLDLVTFGKVDEILKIQSLKKLILCSFDEQHQNCLHLSVLSGNYRLTKILLENHADPNICDNFLWTPLHRACYQKELAIVDLLLDFGSSVDSLNSTFSTPLHYLCKLHFLDDPKAPDSWEIGKNLIDKFLSLGAGLEFSNQRYETPVIVAIKAQSMHVAKYLISKGVILTEEAMMGAVFSGNIEFVKLLLDHSCNFTTEVVAQAEKLKLNDIHSLLVNHQNDNNNNNNNNNNNDNNDNNNKEENDIEQLNQ